MEKNCIFFSFLILNLLFLNSNSLNKIEPLLSKTRSNSFIELTRQSNDITLFTDSLRQDHVYFNNFR